jgi:exodeoxyribonuclease V gamma subunit
VADLYDQYLVYRPEWLMRWEADQRVDGLGDAQQWQAPLWKALVSYTAELGQRSGTAPISTSALSAPGKGG